MALANYTVGFTFVVLNAVVLNAVVVRHQDLANSLVDVGSNPGDTGTLAWY